MQVLRVPRWMVRLPRVVEPQPGYLPTGRDRLHVIGTPEAIERLRLGVTPPAPP